jgi:hypothetical protein
MIKGVVYGDTWGGRRTATDQVIGVGNTIEFLLRKQNWSTPLIKLSGIGSFDDASMTILNSLPIAREVLSQSEAWTDTLIKSLCEEFFLYHYQDGAGYECLINIMSDKTPIHTITFTDCKDRGAFSTPDSSDIYCEPVINYAYDYATERYTKSLRVTNITESAWQASYTPGFTGTEGQAFWNRCKELYNKYGIINKVPSTISDSKWIVDYETAKLRLNYLTGTTDKNKTFVDKLRATLSIWYSVAGGVDWIPGQRVNLLLPTETDGNTIECVIEKITKNRNNRTCNVTLILLDDIAEGDFVFTEVPESPLETFEETTESALETFEEVPNV